MALSIVLAVLSSGCRSPRADTPGAFGGFRSEQDRHLAGSLAHYARGMLLRGESPSETEAIADEYAQAVRHGNVPAELYSQAAAASIRAHDTARALEILKRACREYPDHPRLRTELAGALSLAGDVKDAMHQFRAARRLDPTQPFAYLALAAIHFERNEDEKAFDILRGALEATDAKREITRACYGQGSRYFREEQPERAIACFDFVAHHVPEQRAAIYHLVAELYLTEDKHAAAREYLEKAVREAHPLPESFIKLAAIVHGNDPRRAIEILNRGIKIHPDNPVFLQLLGELYRSQNRLQEAITVLEDATRRDHPLPESFVTLAVLLYEDQPERAIRILEEAAKRLPDNTTILFVLARIYMEHEAYPKAVGIFERIREIIDAAASYEPSERFFLYYGGACEQAGDIDKAAAILEEGIEKFPESHEMLNHVAYLWAENAIHLDKALTYVQRALKLKPDSAAYLDTLGWIYYKRRDYPAALANLRKANELLPDDPILHDHLGDAYEALGDTEQAVAHWTQSLRLNPDDQALVRKLADKGIDVEAIRRRARQEGSATKAPPESDSE